MLRLNDAATWTAALSAVVGTACLVEFFSGAIPQSYVLIGAETAAVIGVLSLLLSVLVIYLLTRPRTGTNSEIRSSPACLGRGEACLHKRRAVLDERLNIDEPRLCSQFMIPCTCWSFCGRFADENCVPGATPGERKPIFLRSTPSQTNELRVLHRNGMNNCPFRFASPLERSMSPG